MRILAGVLMVLSLAGCAVSDDSRTDIVNIEGHDCAVTRNGAGRITSVGDCDLDE